MITRVAAGALLCAMLVGFSAAHAAKAVDIGVAAAVRPQATGTPPQQDARILYVGIDLSANERIETGRAGQTHLLFRDGSSISVGPNASLVLDEFVYDPQSKTGNLAVSVTKGVFRFVGGRISKTKPVLFKTPTAVIGIRGGVAMMNVNSPQDVANAQSQGQDLNPANVTMLYGDEVFMDNGQSRQSLTRPGSTMSQTPAGTFTPPRQATQQQLNAALSTLEEPQQSEDGDDGGAGGLGAIAPAAGGPSVNDTDVSDSQLSELGSGNAPQAIGGATPAPPAGDFSSANASATTASQEQGKTESVSTETSNQADPEEEEETASNSGDDEEGGESTGDATSGSGSESGSGSGSGTGSASGSGSGGSVVEGSTGGSEGGGSLGGGGSAVTLPDVVGRARCCEDNGTGTDDGTAALDFTLSNAAFAGTQLNAIGPNGLFVLTLPAMDGVHGVGAGGAPIFGSGVFGDVNGGTLTLALNREFAFYEMFGTMALDRAILLAGPPTPQAAIPNTGFTTYQLFDDSTIASLPNVSRVPFVRDVVSGQDDASRAYIAWDGTPKFGVGRVVISGQGSGQLAGVSVIVGNVATSTDGDSYVDSWQRGSLRQSAGNPRHFDGRIASLPLNAKTQSDSHFIGSTFPSGFHLAAGTANDGLEPTFTGITRRHGAPNNDFTDRPNSVGLLDSHSATPPGTATTEFLSGFAGGVLAYYIPSSTSTAPNGFQPFIAEDSGTTAPGFFVHKDAVNRDLEAGLDGSAFDNGSLDVDFAMNLGGFGGNGTSIFIDDSIFMARENDSTPTSAGNVGGLSLNSSSSRFHLTTPHNFEHSGFQGGVSFCSCSFLTWGFFGFDIVDPTEGDLVRSQLATWVVGRNPTSNINQFPDGSASYTGHVFGTVAQGSTVHAAVGDLDMSLNFSSGAVTVTSGTISNFDGGTYAMTDVASPTFTISANLSLTSRSGYNPGDITGRFAGSFFGTGTYPENVAGNFRLERTAGAGADYDAAGIGMAEVVTP